MQTQLAVAGPLAADASVVRGEPNEELARLEKQNQLLKEQVETLNHVQAKLVAKNKRYRDLAKSGLEN